MTNVNIAAALLLLFTQSALATITPQPPAEHFARLPHHSAASLSPSGRHLAVKVPADDRHALLVYDLDQPASQPHLMSPGDSDIRWYRWASDQRLLVSVERRTDRGDRGMAIPQTRLFAVDPDGKNPQVLTPTAPRNLGEQHVRIGDALVDVLPAEPDHVLMSFNASDPSRPRLYRVNIHDGRYTQLASGRRDIRLWTVDHESRPRVGAGPGPNETWRIQHRAADGGRWEVLLEYPMDSQQQFHVLLVDHDDRDLVYVASNHENGRIGLYTYRLSSREFAEQLFLHDERDVVGIKTTPDGRRVAGVGFADDDDYMVWFDERYASIAERAQAALPGWQVAICSASEDLSRVMLIASSPDLPPRLYSYEPASGRLIYVTALYPEIEQEAMGRTLAISYPARDDLVIPGYLTLPAGVSDRPPQPLPAVVIPHGGPHARDYAAFNPLVQMLANRGYAVLRMNFRGSAGYGSAFAEAGNRQWGQAMQDDVTDGTHWLIREGIADPARICIIGGGTYGGYAALMGAVREPDLYACASSFNGVSDLPRYVRFLQRFIGGRAEASRIGGGSWSDQRLLADNSPINRATELRAPVLLVNGARDTWAPPEHTRLMVRALRGAGHDPLHIEFPDGGTCLCRADHRRIYFSELDRFLAQHLAPRPAAAGPAP